MQGRRGPVLSGRRKLTPLFSHGTSSGRGYTALSRGKLDRWRFEEVNGFHGEVEPFMEVIVRKGEVTLNCFGARYKKEK